MQPPPNLNSIFAALAHGVRRSLLRAMARGKALSGRELAQQVRGDSRSIAGHLRVLERAGLVERVSQGQVPRFRLCQKLIQAAAGWISRQDSFHLQVIDALDRRLSEAAYRDRGAE